MADPFRTTVDCYAGYRGEETPRRFTLLDRTRTVTSVIDQWLAPDHRYFKVLADDGYTYILRHDIAGHAWDITLASRR